MSYPSSTPWTAAIDDSAIETDNPPLYYINDLEVAYIDTLETYRTRAVPCDGGGAHNLFRRTDRPCRIYIAWLDSVKIEQVRET